MIDTHAHIDADEFIDDLQDVIERAFNSGLEAVIVPAIRPERFDNLFKTLEMDSRLYGGIGVHPHNAGEVDDKILQMIYNTAAKHQQVKAIGEIGLDYYYDYAPKEVQSKVFREQLEIAKDLQIPVIVHNRDSDEDLFKILNEAQNGKLKGVLHCFSGDEDLLKRTIDLNFNVSFTGNITFKKFDAIQTVKNVPDDRYMIETDSPYMTPVPFRGKRNEPSYVSYIANKIAEIKNIEIDEVIKMTTNNAKKFFGLMTLIMFTLIMVNNNSFAQNNEDEEYYEDYEEHPGYNKFIGFGPVIGTNTIVESYNPRPNNVSYEGLLSLGGIIHYSLSEYIILSGSYVYSKNEKLKEIYKDLEPNIHQQIEITANFIVNPHSRINLYGFVGPSYLFNDYGIPSTHGGGIESKNSLGVNTGLGFFFNIPINGAGLITFSAEWKLNFMLSKNIFEYDSRELPGSPYRNQPVEVSTFFSIPRMNIIYYPEF